MHDAPRPAGAVAVRGLAAGLALGAADALATLALLGDASGLAAGRAWTVVGALAVDTAAVGAALGAAAALARGVGAGAPVRVGLATAAVAGALGIAAVKLQGELAPQPVAAAPRLAAVAGTALVLGALAFVRVRRRAGAPLAPGRALAGGALAAGLALGVALGGAPAGPVGAGDPARPGVLLVSIDTLRPDRLGAYGGPRISPRLDALAREGALFEAAYAASNWTLPSHATLLTGQDPLVHGVDDDGDVLAPDAVPLGRAFRAAGYRTAAFVGTQARGFVGAHRGFGRGFEVYHHEPHPPAALEGLLARMLHRVALARLRHGVGAAAGEVDAASRWLRVHADEPFLLFVHLYDVHSKSSGLPYDAPTPFRERVCPALPAGYDGCAAGRCASSRLHAAQEGEAPLPTPEELVHLRCLYDAGVAYADAQVGRLLDALEATGAAERTLVAVTADHGEAFLEHGHLLHRHLHEEVARIPLLLRGPGVRPGTRVATPVRLADVAPTLLALAGVPAPPGMQGPGLASALRQGREPAPRPVHARGREALLRLGRWKLLLPRSPEARPAALHDLARDPGERVNLLDEAPAPALRRLEDALARIEDAASGGGGATGRRGLALSATDRRRLEALGYLAD